MKKHNGIISFWKFMFCLMIVAHHGSSFAGAKDYAIYKYGAIGVEFFFLVSGYLFAASVLRKQKENDTNVSLGKETVDFIVKKVKSFLPYAVIAWVTGIIILKAYEGIRILDISTSIFDLFFLRMSGIQSYIINGPDWYISSMLICMAVLYPLVRKYGKKFIYVVTPIIIILLGGYLNQNFGSLRAPTDETIFFYKGTLRALFELNIGMYAYVMCEKISKFEFSNLGRFILTVMEGVFFALPFIINQLWDYPTSYDYVVVLLLTIAIIISFTGQTLLYNTFNNKFIYYLEKLSLPIYLYHMLVRSFIRRSSIFYGWNYMQKNLALIIISIVVSIIIMTIVEAVRKKKIFEKLKYIVLEKPTNV